MSRRPRLLLRMHHMWHRVMVQVVVKRFWTRCSPHAVRGVPVKMGPMRMLISEDGMAGSRDTEASVTKVGGLVLADAYGPEGA